MRRFLVGLFVLPAATLSAQAITLEQAMERATKNHPDFRVLEAELSAAEGNKISAGALPNPELSIGPGLKKSSGGGSSSTDFHGELGVSQLFEFPGKKSMRVFLADRNIRLREIALEGFRFQLLIEVRRIFFQAQIAHQVAKLRSEQVQSAQTFLQAARKRVEGGYASDFEAMKAQTDLIAARKGLGDALAEVRSEKLKLSGLMGSPSDTLFEIEGEFDRASIPSPKSDPLSQALAANPGIKAGILQMEIAEKGIEAAKVNWKPDLTVNPSMEYTKDEQVYGLNLSLPLPVWNRGKGEIQSANAEHRKAKAELEKLKQEISLAVQTAQDRAKLAEEQLALYPPEFLDGLKSIMTRAEKVYGQSSTTLLIYLDARRSYFDGLADYYQTLGDWAENHLELESAVGDPTATEIHKDGEQKP